MATTGSNANALKRTLGPILVTFYGLGTIIGAGIYVLLGSVADFAGNLLPWSFLLAGLIATFTALSYAELSSRLPQCAGAAVYIHEAWNNNTLSTLVGWLLVFTGIVSAATIANGFVGYLNVFITLGPVPAITLLVFALGMIAAWDIKSSAVLIAVVTLLEVVGLLLVAGFAALSEPGIPVPAAVTIPESPGTLPGVLLGTFVAFYAFIGFEDMVNIVEEVKKPIRTMPLGIMLSVLIALCLYIAVALAALHVLPAGELARSEAPLADVMVASGGSAVLITLISLVAVINGALVQIIMASRVMYGMAGKSMAPALLSNINSYTRTPIVATVLAAVLVLVFALALPLTRLAQITSFCMLVIFILVNAALVVIKRRFHHDYHGLNLPVVIPVLGMLTALALVTYQVFSTLAS